MKRMIISVLVVVAAAVVAYPQESKSIHPNPGNSVTRTLRAAGNFKTFLSLLEKAGLKNLGLVPTDQRASSVPVDRRGSVQLRPGNDPRYQTVFAPNDAAFARLPPGALETLKKDRARLRSFLLAHMLPGKLMVEDLFQPVASSSKTFKAANGSDLSLIWTAGMDGMSSLQINGKARVGKFQDVMASDYLIVIHEIDAVLFGDGSV